LGFCPLLARGLIFIMALFLKVDAVKPGSKAARIGLKKDDVILGVNQQKVANLGELRKILDSKPSVLALDIQRGDTSIYLLAQ